MCLPCSIAKDSYLAVCQTLLQALGTDPILAQELTAYYRRTGCKSSAPYAQQYVHLEEEQQITRSILH